MDQQVLQGITSFADVKVALAAAASLDDLAKVQEATDLAFLREQLPMTDDNWDEMTFLVRRCAAKFDAAERGETLAPEQEPRRIEIPADQWAQYEEAYSGDRASETKRGKLVPVRSVKHEGHLYTAFSIASGVYGDRPRHVDGYRLVPVSLYKGETTRAYHDDQSVLNGHRRRGDLLGLIVTVRGDEVVCAEKVTFEVGMPKVPPMPLEPAVAFNNSLERGGWRALHYAGGEKRWSSYEGHPVVEYRDASGEKAMRVMFWRDRYGIHEFSLSPKVPLAEIMREAAAKQQGEGGNAPAAINLESGSYRGRIEDVTAEHVMQSIGKGVVVRHERARIFSAAAIGVGAMAEVRYRGGQATLQAERAPPQRDQQLDLF